MLEPLQGMSLLTIMEIVGPLLLLAVLICGALQWSRRRRGPTQAVREASTRQLYREVSNAGSHLADSPRSGPRQSSSVVGVTAPVSGNLILRDRSPFPKPGCSRVSRRARHRALLAGPTEQPGAKPWVGAVLGGDSHAALAYRRGVSPPSPYCGLVVRLAFPLRETILGR